MENAYHLLFSIFILLPVAISIVKIIQFRSELGKSTVLFEFKGLNSSVLYALAFNLIFFVQELFLALGKKWLGLTAYLYHNNHGWDGSHELTALMQGSGALAIFLLGLFMVLLDFKMKQSSTWWRQLIFWLGFQGLVMSLPQFQTAMLAKDTDTGQALTYLGVGPISGFVVSVLTSLVLVIALRYYSARLMWNDTQGLSAATRFKCLLRSVAMPALIGIVLIIPFRILPWHQIVLPVTLMIIYLPWILAFGWMKPMRNVQPLEKPASKIEVLPLILLAALLIFFQGVLSDGLVF